MKKLYIFALVAMLFAACATDAIDEQSVKVEEQTPDTLVGTFEGDDSRIQLQNGKTVWTKGDLVSVFYRSNANQKWQYQGETGERTGNLKRIANADGSQEMSSVVVVYPYNENYYINHRTCNVKASLPPTQTYLKDSYGLDGNIMVSQSEYNQFSLKNVCGWLKIQLTGNGEKVKSIKLKGNAGEQIAGEIYINSATAEATLAAEMGGADDNENSAGGNLVFDDTILTEVVLNCGEGVTLSNEPTAFYIALPPQTFERGVTVEIRDIDGYLMTQSTENSITILRNAIQPMAALEYVGDFDKSEYCLTTTFQVDSSLECIVYKEGFVGAENTLVNIDYGDGTFGKDKKHIYPAEGDYTVKFYLEKPITEIGKFFNSALKSIVIPKDVVKIGSLAFSYSIYLTSVDFETDSKLTTIEDSAFSYCRDLESIHLPNSVTEIGDCVFSGCTSLEIIYCSNDFYDSYTIYDSLNSGVYGVVLGVIGATLNDYTSIIAYPAGCKIENINAMFGFNTKIKWGAFAYCNNIKHINITDLKEIEQHNFIYCDALQSISLTDVTTLQNNVFTDCKSLESLYLPLASEIGEYCFINNESLTSIYLGCDELKTINKMGNNNASLNTLWIPSGVESITESFNSCAALENIYCKATTPPALTNSFDSIPATAKIYVPYESVEAYKTAEVWKDYANYIVGYDFEKGEVVENIPETWKIYYTATAKVTPYKSDGFGANIVSNEWDESTGEGVITFDDQITKIGREAFEGCNSLTSIIIPNSITEIGYSTFENCSSLTSITIPNSVTKIDSFAFYSCDKLRSVTIGNGVTSIGELAFDQCFKLVDVYCQPITPPAIYYYRYYDGMGNYEYRYSFHKSTALVIYVPRDSYDAYKKSTGCTSGLSVDNWYEYESKIVAYDF